MQDIWSSVIIRFLVSLILLTTLVKEKNCEKDSCDSLNVIFNPDSVQD